MAKKKSASKKINRKINGLSKYEIFGFDDTSKAVELLTTHRTLEMLKNCCRVQPSMPITGRCYAVKMVEPYDDDERNCDFLWAIVATGLVACDGNRVFPMERGVMVFTEMEEEKLYSTVNEVLFCVDRFAFSGA